MNQPIKLLLDECVGHPIVQDMEKLLSWDNPKPIIQHLFHYFQPGSLDPNWIPKIANDGWIILTFDRGKKSSKMKLPDICVAYKVTHILMGPSIMKLKQYKKVAAIISAWEDIKKCNDAPKGSRFVMQITASGSARLKQVILHTTVSPPPPSQSACGEI